MKRVGRATGASRSRAEPHRHRQATCRKPDARKARAHEDRGQVTFLVTGGSQGIGTGHRGRVSRRRGGAGDGCSAETLIGSGRSLTGSAAATYDSTLADGSAVDRLR